jgi:hypothetical protein
MSKEETRGRKPNSEKGKEVKQSSAVYLYPSEKKKIIKKHGSLTAAILTTIDKQTKK